MKKMCSYIIFSLFFSTLLLAGQKNKASFSVLAGQSAISEGTLIQLADGEEQNFVQRKRAHKRKRQIRPRRNGF